jgi:hypothetical protein
LGVFGHNREASFANQIPPDVSQAWLILAGAQSSYQVRTNEHFRGVREK